MALCHRAASSRRGARAAWQPAEVAAHFEKTLEGQEFDRAQRERVERWEAVVRSQRHDGVLMDPPLSASDVDARRLRVKLRTASGIDGVPPALMASWDVVQQIVVGSAMLARLGGCPGHTSMNPGWAIFISHAMLQLGNCQGSSEVGGPSLVPKALRVYAAWRWTAVERVLRPMALGLCGPLPRRAHGHR